MPEKSKRPKKINPPESPMAERLKELQALIPWAFADGEMDLEAIQRLTGAKIAAADNRYRFQWAGAKECFKALRAPAAGALVPRREDSADFDNTKNLYIEGENLEVLKLLQRAYAGRVKMVYIDPPYNTGNDFVYADNFGDPLSQYLRATGQVDEQGNAVNASARRVERKLNGRKHSKWMAMMFPRLFVARTLLREDGVIFVSIDDNEVHHLRMLMNQVFGEENFIGLLPTIMNLKGNQDEVGFAGTHEYTIVFAKDKEKFSLGHFSNVEEDIADWDMDDHGLFKRGANLKSTGVNAPREKRPHLYFPLYVGEEDGRLVVKTSRWTPAAQEIFPLTDGREMSWRWQKAKFDREPHNLIVEKANGNGYAIYKKQRPGLGDLPSKKPKTTLYRAEYSSGNGTQQLRKLFAAERIQDNPKPLMLIRDFVEIGGEKDSIIMDFFSGSGTTAHAVMQLNAEDGGKRRCISVQMPEPTPENSEARKAGFDNIAQIGRERLRRAGEKIREAQNGNMFGKETDIGFRAFAMQQSAFKQWRGTPEMTTESVKETLREFDNLIVDDADDDALLHEILLAVALPLTAEKEKLKLGKNAVWKITDDGAADKKPVYICLDRKLYDDLLVHLLGIGMSAQDSLIVRDDAMTDGIAAAWAGQCNLTAV